MATMYEISGDILALKKLIDGIVDEDGEPREPTAEEFETMKKWIEESQEDFTIKFNNICRFVKNLKVSATNVETEKKSFKDEVSRLTKRAKSFSNRAKTVTNLLRWSMERLDMKKFKSDFFTAGIQNIGDKVISVAMTATQEDIDSLPEKYLKPREVNTQAILQDLKEGTLEEREGAMNFTKVFVKGGDVLPFIHVSQPTTLMIR